MVHKTGATIHVVHMVYQSELDGMEQEIGQYGITISPQFYTQQLFVSLEEDIAELLLNHFNLDKEHFVVHYEDAIGLNKRRIAKGMETKSNRDLAKKLASIIQSKQGAEDVLMSKVIQYYQNGDPVFRKILEKSVAEYERIKMDDHEIKQDDKDGSDEDSIDIVEMEEKDFGSKAEGKSIEDGSVSIILTDDGKDHDDDESKRDVKIDEIVEFVQDNMQKDDNSYGEWMNDDGAENLLNELLDEDEPTSQML